MEFDCERDHLSPGVFYPFYVLTRRDIHRGRPKIEVKVRKVEERFLFKDWVDTELVTTREVVHEWEMRLGENEERSCSKIGK